MKEPFQTSHRQRRDLRLLIAGRTTSTFGDEMALIALLIAAYQTGSGAPAIAALLIAGALPAALLAGWAGGWVDRCDSRTLLIGVGVAQTAACAALAVIHSFVGQLALVGILSALQVVSGPAWQALVPRIVGESQVGRVVGVLQSAALIAGLAGAAIGGLVVTAFGVQIALVIDAVTFCLLTVAAAAIHTRRRMPSTLDSPTRIGDGWRLLRGDALLAPLLGGLLAFIVVGEATNVVEVLLVTDVLGGGAFALGMLGAVFGLSAAIGAAAASRIQTEQSRVNASVVNAGVLALMTIVAGLSINLAMLSAAWAIAGVSLGTLQVCISTLLVTRTRDEWRGRVLATTQGLGRAAALGATALGGILGAVTGPRATFVIAGLAAFAVSLALWQRVWTPSHQHAESRRTLKRRGSSPPSARRRAL